MHRHLSLTCLLPAVLAVACGDPAESGGAPADGTVEDMRRSVTVLRVHYPAGAHAVSVRGDGGGLSWDRGQPMTRTGDGVYEYRLNGLREALSFKPLLDDGTWSRGQNYQVRPGAVADVYPHFYTAAGRFSRHWASFHSSVLGNDRGVWVYLPPSYDENPLARYPVIYMHDGQNLFDPRYAFGGTTWQADEAMDGGIDALDPAMGIPEAIIVGPENTADRISEYTPAPDPEYGGGGGDRYLRFLVEELKPQVDMAFRTRPEASATALIGSSLGGLISAYAGLVRPATFGRIGVLSPSTWWDGLYIVHKVEQSAGQSPKAARVYVDSGDGGGEGGDDLDNTRRLADTYRSKMGYQDGVDFLYVVQRGGQHNEAYWAQRLPGALHFLLGGL